MKRYTINVDIFVEADEKFEALEKVEEFLSRAAFCSGVYYYTVFPNAEEIIDDPEEN